MNHLKPRQKISNKKWEYTLRNNDQVYPVGYCSNKKCNHDSYEEACNCYKKYLIETSFKIVQIEDVQYKCKICKSWTNLEATVGYGCLLHFPVCKDHANKQDVWDLFQIDEMYTS